MSGVADLVSFFQAMSDPTRQHILLLLEQGERCVGDLVKEFDCRQPTISRHLAVLKNAGLVSDRRQGQQVYYRLNPDRLNDCCGQFLERFRCCRDGKPGPSLGRAIGAPNGGATKAKSR